MKHQATIFKIISQNYIRLNFQELNFQLKKRLTMPTGHAIILLLLLYNIDLYAIVVQLVVRHLAKVEVAGSSPVYRSS